MFTKSVARHSKIATEFLDKEWLELPEGQSEALDMQEFSIIACRDALRSTHFCITVYNTETPAMIHHANPTVDDFKSELELIIESIARFIVKRHSEETFQPILE